MICCAQYTVSYLLLNFSVHLRRCKKSKSDFVKNSTVSPAFFKYGCKFSSHQFAAYFCTNVQQSTQLLVLKLRTKIMLQRQGTHGAPFTPACPIVFVFFEPSLFVVSLFFIIETIFERKSDDQDYHQPKVLVPEIMVEAYFSTC